MRQGVCKKGKLGIFLFTIGLASSFFGLTTETLGQVSQGGQPVSLTESLSSAELVILPTIDSDTVYDSDTAQGIHNRVSVPLDVNLDMTNSGTWDTLSDGSLVWRLQVYSANAFAVHLVFDGFTLPPGATFFICNAQQPSFYIGAFTDANHKPGGVFATQPITGDEIILEYHEPAGATVNGSISISTILHTVRSSYAGSAVKYRAGATPAASSGYGNSHPCEIDLRCPEGIPYRNVGRSVVRILDNLGLQCTGTLVNNIAEDGTPYVFTANHCLNGNEAAWVAELGYDNRECNASTTEPIPNSIVGAEIMTAEGLSDISLVKFLPPGGIIPNSYNPYFSGWDNSPDQPSNNVLIHHPAGDVKKISFSVDQISVAPGGRQFWVTFHPIQGTGAFEGGSSGAALFSPAKRVIGTHSGFGDTGNPDLCDFVDQNGRWSRLNYAWTIQDFQYANAMNFYLSNNDPRTTLDGYDPIPGTKLHVPGAHSTIQAAIDVAGINDTVYVAPNTYTGAGNTNISFNGKDITVMSSGGRDVTFINCQSSVDTRGFIFNNNESGVAKLDGFTIQNGNHSAKGGGILVESSPEIVNCSFESCTAPLGGAIYLGNTVYPISPMILSSTFSNNSSSGAGGGAIYLGDKNEAFVGGIKFTGNQAAAGSGGAIYISPTSGMGDISSNINNCTFDGNSSGIEGAGVYIGAKTSFFCNTIVNHTGSGTTNSAVAVVGANADVTIHLINFAQNTLPAVYCSGSGFVDFSCSNFWDNGDLGAVHFIASGDCSSPVGTNGNISSDPMFCDAPNGNYSLDWSSESLPGNGSALCVYAIGSNGAGCGQGPTLMNYPNPLSTSDHSPTMDWTDATGAGVFSYEVEVDNNSDFSSPEYSPVGLINSQWTASPNLTDGNWYWRVRAKSVRVPWWTVYGEWSTSNLFTAYTPSNPPPSCPVLFSYNGSEYVQHNPLLTACEESGYRDEVVDHYLVETDVVAESGTVTFQLRELEDEITYLRDFELITVDHSPEISVKVSVDGDISSFISEPLQPIYAIDHLGVDQVAAIRSNDGELYEADGAGYLTITFENPGSRTGIEFFATSKANCPAPIFEKTVSGSVANHGADILVELLSIDQEWIPIDGLPPRVDVTHELLLDVDPDLIGDSPYITLRISWSNGYTTDAIQQYLSTDVDMSMNHLQPLRTSLQRGTVWAERPETAEYDDLTVLRNGDIAQFQFETGEVPEGLVREYIIRATGRYQPDYSIHTSIMPTTYQLYDNYPNPFNPETIIEYDLPKVSEVQLEIINILGRRIRTLVHERQETGHYTVRWDGRDDGGTKVASGVYFYKLASSEFKKSKKMVLLK